MKRNAFRAPGIFILLILLPILGSSCAGRSAPTPDIQGTAQVLVLNQAMTGVAITMQALSATQTEAARPSATPTTIPSPTVTPGPVVIRDDFSADTGRWEACGQCVITNGSLYMGPYPVSDKGEGYITLCRDCGLTQDYKMGVDAIYQSGYSDRGFGLVLREQGGSFVEVEISTWQYFGVWFFDATKKNTPEQWRAFLENGWVASGYLHPAQLSNHIDVEVSTEGGKSTAAISFNGRPVRTVEIPNTPARVGLVVGLHSLGIAFDNFYFEGYPTVPEPSPGSSSG